jgi:hypothetical protein
VQGQFFYVFDLDKVVPPDHLVRQIDAMLDLSWVHRELAAFYSHTGRPSIDQVLMIRMLIIGYVFAIRSEQGICTEVQVNLAYSEAHDNRLASKLLSRLKSGSMLLADRGYDADWIRALAARKGALANIPPRYNRRAPICFSPYLY